MKNKGPGKKEEGSKGGSGRRKNYCKEHLLGSLEYVAGSLRKSQTKKEHDNFRKDNPGLDIPSSSTIEYRFDSWNKAKQRVGLEIYEERPPGMNKYSSEELRKFRKEVEEDFGRLPSESEYEVYRRNREEDLPHWGRLMDVVVAENSDD